METSKIVIKEDLTHPFFQFLGFTIVFALFVILIILCIGLCVFINNCFNEDDQDGTVE